MAESWYSTTRRSWTVTWFTASANACTKFNGKRATGECVLRIKTSYGLVQCICTTVWGILYFERVNAHGTCIAQGSWFLNDSFLKIVIDYGANLHCACNRLQQHSVRARHVRSQRHPSQKFAFKIRSQKITFSFHLSHGTCASSVMVIGSPFAIAFGLVKNGTETCAFPTVCVSVLTTVFAAFGGERRRRAR